MENIYIYKLSLFFLVSNGTKVLESWILQVGTLLLEIRVPNEAI